MNNLQAAAWFAKLADRFFGGYKQRVREGLIETGGSLVSITHAPILKKIKGKKRLTKKEKLIHHYCRKWKADRIKLK